VLRVEFTERTHESETYLMSLSSLHFNDGKGGG